VSALLKTPPMPQAGKEVALKLSAADVNEQTKGQGEKRIPFGNDKQRGMTNKGQGQAKGLRKKSKKTAPHVRGQSALVLSGKESLVAVRSRAAFRESVWLPGGRGNNSIPPGAISVRGGLLYDPLRRRLRLAGRYR
jgi:hypothetical protein